MQLEACKSVSCSLNVATTSRNEYRKNDLHIHVSGTLAKKKSLWKLYFLMDGHHSMLQLADIRLEISEMDKVIEKKRFHII